MAERREKCLQIRYLGLFAVEEGGSISDWMVVVWKAMVAAVLP
jgi:hypothetical protein